VTTLAAPILGGESRRFGNAVALSIAVHAAAFVLVPDLRLGAQQALQPLTVSFLQPVLEAVRPSEPTVEAPPPAPPPSRPLRNTAAERQVSRSEPAAQVVPAEHPPILTAAAEAAAPTPSSFSVPPQPAAAPEPVSERVQVAAVSEPPAEVLVGDYELEAARALAASVRKHYPRMARERGWQGRVEVRVHFRRGGLVGEVALARSSGFAVLDEQALDMVKTADMPQLPQTLRGKDFYVSLPVEFRLQRN
jgi:protein TonB